MADSRRHYPECSTTYAPRSVAVATGPNAKLRAHTWPGATIMYAVFSRNVCVLDEQLPRPSHAAHNAHQVWKVVRTPGA